MAFVLTATLGPTPRRAPRQQSFSKRARTSRAPPPPLPRPSKRAPKPLPNPAPFDLLDLATATPTLQPTIVPAYVPPTLERPKRKPHGFWNDLSNLKAELEQFCRMHRIAARTIPSVALMRLHNRGDMLAALQKHGGVKRVAEQLRWSRNRTRARRRVGADGGEAVGKRVKVLRRPVAYWNDVERVKVEIGAFVDEFGTRGCMPTQKQFQMVGRSDLLNAAGRHGGLVVIAKMMGFRTRKKPRPRNHWNDLETVKKALVDFANTYTDGKMPTGDELVARGESGLANAVPVHGGFPKVAEICGLQRRSVGSGAPVVWDEVRLRREIIGFLVAHVPRKARERVMPSERELRKFGRNDLSYAVQKFGGFKKVAVVCGLQSKKKGPFVGKTEETSGDA